jgi:hypothetical protein
LWDIQGSGTLRGDANTEPLEERCVNPGNEVYQVLDGTVTLRFKIGQSREDNEIRRR